MSDLIPWEYGGHTFHVAATMSDAAKDRACATLLSEFDSRRARNSLPLPKPLEVPSGMIPSIPCQDPLGGVTHGLESFPTPSLELLNTLATMGDDMRYEQGYYRKPCRVCLKPIKRSGSVGRAPVIHKECESDVR